MAMPDCIRVPAEWTTDAVPVIVAGAGGTGSEIMDRLFKLHMCLLKTGGAGLDLTLYDDDVVTDANIGKQRFWPSDVGLPKAKVIVERYNIHAGLKWRYQVAKVTPSQVMTFQRSGVCLLVSATDSVQFRCDMGQQLRSYNGRNAFHWLDCGNDATSGQVIWGVADAGKHIPNVHDLFSTSLETAPPDAGPSCSVAEALRKQDLMVNCFMADAAIALLWQLLRRGKLEVHGTIVDVTTLSTHGLRICPDVWASLGYQYPNRTRARPSRKQKAA